MPPLVHVEPNLNSAHLRRNLLAAALWLILVSIGVYYLMVFGLTPGPRAAAPRQWPVASHLKFPSQTTLVIAIHPKCSCTRATLSELESILTEAPKPPAIKILLFRPAGSPVQWTQTSTVAEARSIPGVSIFDDIAGTEAARFGALTSGHALLYDAAGALLFEGGITESRGEIGDNRGYQIIISLLKAAMNGSKSSFSSHAATTVASSTPVFGCPITTQSRRASL